MAARVRVVSKMWRVSRMSGLLPHHVVRDPGERGGGLQGGPQRERLVALGVDAAVPAVHEVAREGELRAHRPGGAQAGVVEGDRVAEEGRAGVVPVVLRFDHLGSDRRHELAGVDLHAGADEDARVGLLDVLVDLLAFRDRAGRALLLRLEERGQVGGPAEPQVGAEADPALGGRHLGEVDLRRAQREGVVLHVVGAQRRVRPVEVVAVVDVHPAAHLDLRLGRGCRRRLGRRASAPGQAPGRTRERRRRGSGREQRSRRAGFPCERRVS